MKKTRMLPGRLFVEEVSGVVIHPDIERVCVQVYAGGELIYERGINRLARLKVNGNCLSKVELALMKSLDFVRAVKPTVRKIPVRPAPIPAGRNPS